MKRKILIGIDDFKRVIEEKGPYIDKSSFILEMLDNGAGVTAITRPRRFGKTLNMSMLSYFFDIESGEKNRALFEGLEISKSKYFKTHMGNHPVISISFKQVKGEDWEQSFRKIEGVIAEKFLENKFLLNSTSLEDEEKVSFNRILKREARMDEVEEGITLLSKLLHKHYNRKVVILIDEYDTPMIEGELNGYFSKAVRFMRVMLSGALKGNLSLYKGVLTGITRLQGAGIFSGLNNAKICTIFSEEYKEKFGFTEEEVGSLLKEYGLEKEKKKVREYYNGYNFNGEVIYNPYSVLNYMDTGKLDNYWLGSSSNDLAKKKIKDLIDKGSGKSITKMFEHLLQGGDVDSIIKDRVSISKDMGKEDILNLLLSAGYLKYDHYFIEDAEKYAKLSIPNREVRSVYKATLRDWVNKNYTEDELANFREFVEAISFGSGEDIRIGIERYLENRSLMDGEKIEEKGYHNFFFGMFQVLMGSYLVESNLETGRGKCDIMLMPLKVVGGNEIDLDKKGIIFEFEVGKEDKLDKLSREAIKQIEEKQYYKKMEVKGIKRAKFIGVAFYKKSVKLSLKEVLLKSNFKK